MIKRITGAANIIAYPKSASETFAFNDVVMLSATGYLTKALSSTPRAQIVGLIQTTVLSTDADYASATMVPVDVPDQESEFEADVDTGTAVQAMVGSRFDLNDNNGVNVSGTGKSTGVFEVIKIMSTSKVRGKFFLEKRTGRLVTYTQSITRAEFTDGGSTAGTLDLSVTIPAGAVFLQSLITDIVGFTGDTSATIIIGVTGGDTDRYSTGTPSVFTTAAAGVDLGVPSGTKWHTAAAVPTVLVTSNADFTNVTAGSAVITLMWLEGK